MAVLRDGGAVDWTRVVLREPEFTAGGALKSCGCDAGDSGRRGRVVAASRPASDESVRSESRRVASAAGLPAFGQTMPYSVRLRDIERLSADAGVWEVCNWSEVWAVLNPDGDGSATNASVEAAAALFCAGLSALGWPCSEAFLSELEAALAALGSLKEVEARIALIAMFPWLALACSGVYTEGSFNKANADAEGVPEVPKGLACGIGNMRVTAFPLWVANSAASRPEVVRTLDECTDALVFSPTYSQKESGSESDVGGYMNNSMWAGAPPPLLSLLYPDFKPLFGSDLGVGARWIYAQIQQPWDDDDPCADDHAVEEWRAVMHDANRRLFPYTFLTFAIVPFALYRLVGGIDPAPGDQTLRYRFWVGAALMPSIFANWGGKLEALSWDDIPEEISAAGEKAGLYQTLMAGVRGIWAKVAWAPPDLSGCSPLMNVRAYPCGGASDLGDIPGQQAYVQDPYYDRGFFSAQQSGEGGLDEYEEYESFFGAVGVQDTAGTACSHLGNMLRADVEVRLCNDDGSAQVNLDLLPVLAFYKAFGAAVEWSTSVRYKPAFDQGADGNARMTVRGRLGPPDLRDAKDFAEAFNTVRDGSRESRYLFNNRDFASIKWDGFVPDTAWG